MNFTYIKNNSNTYGIFIAYGNDALHKSNYYIASINIGDETKKSVIFQNWTSSTFDDYFPKLKENLHSETNTNFLVCEYGELSGAKDIKKFLQRESSKKLIKITDSQSFSDIQN